jgi:predicted RNase H-like HicB family nuclease
MEQYVAVVFMDPLGNFVVTFPDFPECVALVESLEAAPAAASRALAMHLDEMRRLDEAIPKPSTIEALRCDPQNSGCKLIYANQSARIYFSSRAIMGAQESARSSWASSPKRLW